MLRTTKILITTLALAALTGLAACGDDSDDASSVDSTEAPSGDTGGDPADCSTPGETVTVDIPDFAYDPDPVALSACDEVVWSNSHSQAHTATGNGDQSWNTGNIQSDESSDAVVFDTPGSFTYACALHPFMTGSVEVS